jgi:putative colanic acid biosynthesis acetyltransferase WcaF
VAARAVVLRGVTVGTGAVVGAGAVVAADVEQHAAVLAVTEKRLGRTFAR